MKPHMPLLFPLGAGKLGWNYVVVVGKMTDMPLRSKKHHWFHPIREGIWVDAVCGIGWYESQKQPVCPLGTALVGVGKGTKQLFGYRAAFDGCSTLRMGCF
jgi:hypothetical protein